MKIKQIKPGQIISIKTALREVSNMVDAAHPFIIGEILQRDITSLANLTIGEWKVLRNRFYPNWHKEDWSLDNEQKAIIADLLEKYRETILKQKRLF